MQLSHAKLKMSGHGRGSLHAIRSHACIYEYLKNCLTSSSRVHNEEWPKNGGWVCLELHSHLRHSLSRSSHPEVVLEKGVLKMCSKFTGEHPCQSATSIKLHSIEHLFLGTPPGGCFCLSNVVLAKCNSFV